MPWNSIEIREPLMNFAHLHLLLNHFPIIGTIVGLGLFLVSFLGKNDDLRRVATSFSRLLLSSRFQPS